MAGPPCRRMLTPSLVARASRCLHAWHLECHGDPAQKDVADAGTRMQWARGLAHEQQAVASLADCARPGWDGRDWEAGRRATVELMQQGAPWICQGALQRDDMRGCPDLLQRVAGRSALGAHSYRPVEIKGHAEVTRKDRFQLAAYAHLLEPVLGHPVGRGALWLARGELQQLDLRAINKELQGLICRMRSIRDGQLTTTGLRCAECRVCPWYSCCAGAWHARQCLCLVRGASGETARALHAAGLRTWHDLAALDPLQLEAHGLGAAHAASILRHARARVRQGPVVLAPLALAARPVLHYDIETFGDTVYLHGLVARHGRRREERSFLARRRGDEGAAWRALLTYLARWPGAVLYTWTDYERGFADALWQRHGGDPRGWAVLDRMVDLCQMVQDHFALPVATYSLKEVAPLFGFRWQADDAGGLNAEAWYGEWLAAGDETLLARTVAYNLDDVRAMEVVLDALAAPRSKRRQRWPRSRSSGRSSS